MKILYLIKLYVWVILDYILAPIGTIKLKRYYKEKPICQINYEKDKSLKEICIITVAFNDDNFIYFQNKLLKKYFKGNFQYIVFDNSDINEKSEKIKELCKTEKIAYIRLPKYKANNVSESHGVALNYIYNNYVKNEKYEYFATLDHDIFPIKDFDFKAYLKNQPAYGLVRHNEKNAVYNKDFWYFWPGFSFFNMEYLKDKKINFIPLFRFGGDTGSSNYKSLYSRLDLDKLIIAEQEWTAPLDGKTAWQTGYSSFDCGWIHMLNGSNYDGICSENFDKKYDRFISVLKNSLIDS